MNQSPLKAWEQATEDLKDAFIERYFNCPTDVYWVADVCGEVFYVNDYWFSLQDAIDFFRYDYKPKDMFEYYDYRLSLYDIEKDEQTNPICIRDWKKLKK